MIEHNQSIRLHDSWREPLAPVFTSAPLQRLKAFLAAERVSGKRICPAANEWFAAMDMTPLDNVRVVILGQDPYHGPGQAHGLAFSVRPGIPVPPSLSNIYKELETDLAIPRAKHGHLVHWAEQGVLLLNSVLTVEAGQAASHQGRGWEVLTDAVVDLVNQQREDVVFLLWGSQAQKKATRVELGRHHVLTAPHPSPLSARTGFFGCRHFSRTNAFLASRGIAPIDWALPEYP